MLPMLTDLSVFQMASLKTSLSVSLSICLFVCLSVLRSISLCVFLNVAQSFLSTFRRHRSYHTALIILCGVRLYTANRIPAASTVFLESNLFIYLFLLILLTTAVYLRKQKTVRLSQNSLTVSSFK